MTPTLASYDQKSIFKVPEYLLRFFLGNTRSSLTKFCLKPKTILGILQKTLIFYVTQKQ